MKKAIFSPGEPLKERNKNYGLRPLFFSIIMNNGYILIVN